jgi:hypothetical protein
MSKFFKSLTRKKSSKNNQTPSMPVRVMSANEYKAFLALAKKGNNRAQFAKKLHSQTPNDEFNTVISRMTEYRKNGGSKSKKSRKHKSKTRKTRKHHRK